jgi:hypothetical protein
MLCFPVVDVLVKKPHFTARTTLKIADEFGICAHGICNVFENLNELALGFHWQL